MAAETASALTFGNGVAATLTRLCSNLTRTGGIPGKVNKAVTLNAGLDPGNLQKGQHHSDVLSAEWVAGVSLPQLANQGKVVFGCAVFLFTLTANTLAGFFQNFSSLHVKYPPYGLASKKACANAGGVIARKSASVIG